MTERYMTPIEYVNGKGQKKRAQLYFELDPIELTDWVFANPFEANELRASFTELEKIEQEESRDLTQDEVRMLMWIIKILAELSAGRPDDSGEYFIRDKNWTSSYAYRGFRFFLLTHPKETQEFLRVLMNATVMQEFTGALQKAYQEPEEQATKPSEPSAPTERSLREMSVEEMQVEMQRKIAENAARQASASAGQ